MKKLAIGCAIVLVLGFIAFAGVSYYVYRQARSMWSQVAELKQLPDIERDVRNRDPFVPPDSEELTRTQIERVLKVQTHIRQRLGARFADLEQKYKTLSSKGQATITDVPALMAAYRDLAAAWLDAKRSQVEALNDVGLSLDEYRWVRDQVYRAIGVAYMDFDIGKVMEQILGGDTSVEPGQIRGSVGPAGPEANRKLIEQFKKQFEDNLPLASFGL
jgi:hypothetical protein